MAKRVWLLDGKWLEPKQLAAAWDCCKSWAIVRANRSLKFKYIYPQEFR